MVDLKEAVAASGEVIDSSPTDHLHELRNTLQGPFKRTGVMEVWNEAIAEAIEEAVDITPTYRPNRAKNYLKTRQNSTTMIRKDVCDGVYK